MTSPMKTGIFAPLGAFSSPEYLETLGRAVEERGFHSLWVAEHVVLFDDYASAYPYAEDGRIPAAPDQGILEPFTSLAFLAAVTRRVRLGTGICLVPQRNPVYTAKEVANLDFVSGGRFDFGVGVGWLAEEFRVAGTPFEHRGARCRSYLEVMKRLWCDEISEHKDPYYELPPCRMYPKPVQKPHPPIHFGGESDAALRRVADLGQGWYGFNRTPDEAAAGIGRLKTICAERGRATDEIQVSVSPYLKPLEDGAVERYREAGVDQVIALCFAFDRDGLLSTLDSLVASLVEPASKL